MMFFICKVCNFPVCYKSHDIFRYACNIFIHSVNSAAYERSAYERLQAKHYKTRTSSPMKRCLETAEIIYPYRELQIVENMTELDFGEFDGKSVNELIDRDDYKDWLKGGSPDKRPPGGESTEELLLRLFKGLHEIIMDMMNQELTHCALITHSGIVTNLLAAFGIPKVDPKELTCDPGEGYEVLVTAKMWQQSQAFEILGRIPYYKE